MEWMLMPFKRYADFSGRSRRMEFWMFGLLNLIVYVALMAIVFSTSGPLGPMIAQEEANPLAIYSAFLGGAGILILIWWLFTLIPSVAVTVRRLHDRDMSGWWYLGFVVLSFIPFVGFIASIVLVVILCLDGTPGSNRFGPDPKGRGAAEVFN